MTAPTFRPSDDSVCDDDRPLHAEVQRRAVRNSLWSANERGPSTSAAFLRRESITAEVRTLWRSAASWGYIGPINLWVPTELATPTIDRPQPTVRILIGLRTNGGNGFVRLYPINDAVPDATEPEMTDATDGGSPISERRYAVAESDSTTTEFDLSCIVPVVPGDNRIWIGLQTDADADVSPTTLTTTYAIDYSDDEPAKPSHPAAYSDNLSESFAPFAYIDVATDAISAAAGNFDRFTVPVTYNSTKPSNRSGFLLWEMQPERWRALRPVSAGQFQTTDFVQPTIWASSGELVRAYIDSIGFDLSGAYSLEDRQFGSSFRYGQPPSATLTRAGVTLASDSARRLRLPTFSCHQELGHRLPVADNPARGVPAYWSTLGLTATLATVRRQGLGCDTATPDIGLQQVPSGLKRRLVVAFSALIVDTVAQWADIIGTSVEFRLLLTYGGSSTANLPKSVNLNVPRPGTREWRTLTWSTNQSSAGCEYGTEGLSFRDMWPLWQQVTLTIDEPASFETSGNRYVEIQARSIDAAGSPITRSGRYLIASHACVRIVEVAQ